MSGGAKVFAILGVTLLAGLAVGRSSMVGQASSSKSVYAPLDQTSITEFVLTPYAECAQNFSMQSGIKVKQSAADGGASEHTFCWGTFMKVAARPLVDGVAPRQETVRLRDEPAVYRLLTLEGAEVLPQVAEHMGLK